MSPAAVAFAAAVASAMGSSVYQTCSEPSADARDGEAGASPR
jgi:hypothetical protein